MPSPTWSSCPLPIHLCKGHHTHRVADLVRFYPDPDLISFIRILNFNVQTGSVEIKTRSGSDHILRAGFEANLFSCFIRYFLFLLTNLYVNLYNKNPNNTYWITKNIVKKIYRKEIISKICWAKFLGSLNQKIYTVHVENIAYT